MSPVAHRLPRQHHLDWCDAATACGWRPRLKRGLMPIVNPAYAGKRICFRRLLSNADTGTKRRRRLIWRAARPAV